MHNISFEKREFFFPIFLSFLLIVLSALPVIYGYLRSGENHRFIGFLSDPMDQNVYFDWIRQAREGNILFEANFTTEQHPRNIFILYFLLVGLINRWFSLPSPIAFQVTRAISAFFLLITSYIFVSYFFDTKLYRRLAFLMVCFSAGLGGYFAALYHFFGFQVPAGWTPLDQNMPEVVTFWTLIWQGHSALALCLLLFAFLFGLYSIERDRKIFAALAGVACFILSLFHPYEMFTFFFVTGLFVLYLLITRRLKAKVALLNYSLILLITLPAIIFQYSCILNNVVLKKMCQIAYPPFSGPIGYLLGIGLIFLMAIFGATDVIRRKQERFYFLILWVVAVSIFAYTPLVFFQRRVLNGVQIPFCILAVGGFIRLCNKIRGIDRNILNRKGIILFTIFFILVIPTNIVHLAADFRNAHQRKFPYFLSRDLLDAYSWLEKNADRNSIVLSSSKTSSFIPPYTGLRVFIGHYYETIDRKAKEEKLNKFMQKDTDGGFRLRFLKENQISYFILSDFEKTFGSFEPERVGYLSLVYKNRFLRVFKVRVRE